MSQNSKLKATKRRRILPNRVHGVRLDRNRASSCLQEPNPKPIRDKQNIEEGAPRERKSRGKIRRGVVECRNLRDNLVNSPLDRFASDRCGFRIHEALREVAKGRRTGAHTISTIPWREAPEEERWKVAVPAKSSVTTS
jgi:hypothetical protein